MKVKLIKLFLRLSLAAGFLSAVADRMGLWPKASSVWGSWEPFVTYTGTLVPWVPPRLVPVLAVSATVAEVVLGLGLIIGYKTALCAKASGLLLLIFALCMTAATGIKAPLDYSVFAAAAAAFALSTFKAKFLEIAS